MRLADTALAARSPAPRRRWRPPAAPMNGGITIRLSRRRPRRARSGSPMVAAAPLWKPSWRLVVPDEQRRGAAARLGGGGEPLGRRLGGVRLSLVSGNPAAYRTGAVYADPGGAAGAAGARRGTGAGGRRYRGAAGAAAACADGGNGPGAGVPVPCRRRRRSRRRLPTRRGGTGGAPRPGGSPSPCRSRSRSADGETATCPSSMPGCRPSASGGCRTSGRGTR